MDAACFLPEAWLGTKGRGSVALWGLGSGVGGETPRPGRSI